MVGPSGSISSPNYPNGYGLNEYCRWAISVASTKKASVTVKNLKTEKQSDRLEIRDGTDGKIISIVSGILSKPITYTSASNKLDLKFISDAKNVAAVEGFEAMYHASGEFRFLMNLFFYVVRISLFPKINRLTRLLTC